MKQLKLGGISAILLTLIYVIGIVMQATMLNTGGLTGIDQVFEFAKSNMNLLIVWISLLYIIFGVLLAVLSVSLHDLIAVHSGFTGRLNMVFGAIWSTLVIASGMIYNTGLMTAVELDSSSLFQTTQTIHLAIGGNNEIMGGLWMLSVVYAGMKYGLFSKWINVMGLIAGVAGVLTMVPSLFDALIMVFAFGQMIWWIGIGVTLIKRKVVYA